MTSRFLQRLGPAALLAAAVVALSYGCERTPSDVQSGIRPYGGPLESVLTAPSNVSIVGNGPFNYKVTWSNNGDNTDSSEIWAGPESFETKQTVYDHTVTQYVGSYTGHGQYDAFVFHRYNANTSPPTYSFNSVTH